MTGCGAPKRIPRPLISISIFHLPEIGVARLVHRQLNTLWPLENERNDEQGFRRVEPIATLFDSAAEIRHS